MGNNYEVIGEGVIFVCSWTSQFLSSDELQLTYLVKDKDSLYRLLAKFEYTFINRKKGDPEKYPCQVNFVAAIKPEGVSRISSLITFRRDLGVLQLWESFDHAVALFRSGDLSPDRTVH